MSDYPVRLGEAEALPGKQEFCAPTDEERAAAVASLHEVLPMAEFLSRDGAWTVAPLFVLRNSTPRYFYGRADSVDPKAVREAALEVRGFIAGYLAALEAPADA